LYYYGFHKSSISSVFLCSPRLKSLFDFGRGVGVRVKQKAPVPSRIAAYTGTSASMTPVVPPILG